MPKPDRKTLQLLALFTSVRLLDSTVFRMVFPFLPALARGLGVPVESVAMVVSVRSFPGLFGPPLGAIADMRGRKQALIGALVLFAMSMFIVGIWPTYAVFFIGLVVSGGATVVIDSSIHAYLGDKIPYAQRGQATAIVELGWSMAFVIGIPLMGWSMAQHGWSAPFIWLGAAGLLAGGLIGLVLPHTASISGSWGELRSGLRQIISVTPLFGLLLALLMTLGNQIISIIFGIWMEDSFGLQLEQLGVASIVIGLAGLVGVGLAIMFTDRIGKRRAIGAGIVLNSAICVILPFLHNQLWSVLAALFVFYMSFEFALTSFLPLMTTLSFKARGVYMAAALAALSLGDSLGALVGPFFIRGGLIVNTLSTVTINMVGLTLLILFVRPLSLDQPALEPIGEILEG
jgi:predicted MFS family arabinose efflux permease